MKDISAMKLRAWTPEMGPVKEVGKVTEEVIRVKNGSVGAKQEAGHGK